MVRYIIELLDADESEADLIVASPNPAWLSDWTESLVIIDIEKVEESTPEIKAETPRSPS